MGFSNFSLIGINDIAAAQNQLYTVVHFADHVLSDLDALDCNVRLQLDNPLADLIDVDRLSDYWHLKHTESLVVIKCPARPQSSRSVLPDTVSSIEDAVCNDGAAS